MLALSAFNECELCRAVTPVPIRDLSRAFELLESKLELPDLQRELLRRLAKVT